METPSCPYRSCWGSSTSATIATSKTGVNSLMHPAQRWLVSVALQDGIWAKRGQEKDVECASTAGKKHSQWRKAMPAEV